jgi:hypothetical protein
MVTAANDAFVKFSVLEKDGVLIASFNLGRGVLESLTGFRELRKGDPVFHTNVWQVGAAFDAAYFVLASSKMSKSVVTRKVAAEHRGTLRLAEISQYTISPRRSSRTNAGGEIKDIPRGDTATVAFFGFPAAKAPFLKPRGSFSAISIPVEFLEEGIVKVVQPARLAMREN